jgi:hypothetical protein
VCPGVSNSRCAKPPTTRLLPRGAARIHLATLDGLGGLLGSRSRDFLLRASARTCGSNPGGGKLGDTPFL